MIIAVENEFGIWLGNSRGRALVIQDEVEKTMPHIRSKGRGVYLANGGRAYIDAGCQNEYCTPETSDPSELVIHELAGRRLMADAAMRAGQTLLCSNVDPVYKTTWGHHENYSSSKPIAVTSASIPLLMHLATRMPYAGAGGLSLVHPGVSLVMSPRVNFIKDRLGQQGVDRRTLIFNKHTNHGRSFRNHIICGENLLCQYAGYLKYATTALLVACIDAGLPLSEIRFRQPLLRIINQVNRDLGMQRLYELTDGRRFTVLDVQESLLESVEANYKQLPPWAPRAILRWRQVIDHLRGGYEILRTRIDWMLYRHLLTELCGEMGMDREDLLAGGSIRSTADNEKLRTFKACANEIYVRLHMLNRDSLFDQLEAEGRLDHRLSEVSSEAVDRAVEHPPVGRAAERAALIRKYSKEKGLVMTWAVLEDGRGQPPSNPIERAGNEMKIIITGDDAQRQVHRSLIDEAETCFRRGDYRKALKLYNKVPQIEQHENARHCIETICLCQARSGRKAAALRTLEIHAGLSPEYVHQVYRLFCAVNFGLKPPEELVGRILQQCDSILGEQRADLTAFGYHRYILEQSRAICLNGFGQSGESVALCRTLLANSAHHSRTRMTARTRCIYAAALLAEGKMEAASAEITKAVESQVLQDLHGDLAAFSYPLIARIQEDDSKAREILHQAEASQRKLRNRLGLIRVLCVKARRLHSGEDFDEILMLRTRCKAVRDCELAAQIITRWDEWIDPPDASMPDNYWGI